MPSLHILYTPDPPAAENCAVTRALSADARGLRSVVDSPSFRSLRPLPRLGHSKRTLLCGPHQACPIPLLWGCPAGCLWPVSSLVPTRLPTCLCPPRAVALHEAVWIPRLWSLCAGFPRLSLSPGVWADQAQKWRCCPSELRADTPVCLFSRRVLRSSFPPPFLQTLGRRAVMPAVGPCRSRGHILSLLPTSPSLCFSAASQGQFPRPRELGRGCVFRGELGGKCANQKVGYSESRFL